MTYDRDDLMTVTFDDGTQVRTWHGRFARIAQVVTEDRGADWRDAATRYRHRGMEPSHGVTDGESWMLVFPASDYNFDPQGLPREGEHWSIGTFGRLWINHNLPGLTIMRMTAEGRAFVAAHESVAAKRERLMARVRDLNPDLARELTDVIDDLLREAEDRGEDREYRREGLRG